MPGLRPPGSAAYVYPCCLLPTAYCLLLTAYCPLPMVTGIVSTSEPCKTCQRRPTAFFRFRASSGFLLLRRVKTFEGALCLLCARKVFRDMQARNLTLGWWGLLSLPAMIVFMIDNRQAFDRGTAQLRRPLPADPTNDRKLVGRPVLARPSVLLALAILMTTVAAMATGGFGIDREEWTVGTCVAYSETNAISVPCDAPTAAGSVLAITEDVFACPPATQFFVDLKTGFVACLG